MGMPREFDQFTITDEVIDRFKNTPNPRLKQLMEAVVRHAHALVKETQLTETEWSFAIDFLTRTGQTCSDRRQEFILLSDTLGISMLVDAINNAVPAGATQSTVLGPFFVQDAPVAQNNSRIDLDDDHGGQPLYAEATFTDLQGNPIESAKVDVWHSDEQGNYDIQYGPDASLTRRARFVTGKDGRVTFWTSLPAAYPIPYDGPVGQMLAAANRHPWRPAHLHYMVDAPGFKHLTTHIFVNGDQYLESDAVFGVKKSLVDDFPERPAGTAPDGSIVDRPYRHLVWHFKLPRLDQMLPGASAAPTSRSSPTG
jgi:hydroxyquinol 1,2-dioxygenase